MQSDPARSPRKTARPALRRAKSAATLSLAASMALVSSMMATPAGAVATVVQAFGSNTRGQLGNGSVSGPPVGDYQPVPAAVLAASNTPLADVSALDGGSVHNLALKTAATVVSWGANDDGQLGNCTTTDSLYAAVTVRDNSTCTTTLSSITDISAGGRHSLAVKNNDTVWAWGYNAAGELGDATTVNKDYAVQVKTDAAGTTNLTGISDVSAGSSTVTGDHSLALKSSDKTVWAWGDNNAGQLGDVSTTNRSYAAKVKTCAAGNPDLTGITEIAAGAGHSLARKEDGTAWAWGNNANGELGDGTTTNRNCAVQVLTAAATPLTGVSHISAGSHHSVAIKSDLAVDAGMVFAWGDNQYGQTGQGIIGSVPSGSVPFDNLYAVQVQQAPDAVPLVGVSKISAGGQHTLIVKSVDSTVWCWGRSDHGECGAEAGDVDASGGRLFYQSGAIAVVGAIGGTPATASVVAGGGSHSLVR